MAASKYEAANAQGSVQGSFNYIYFIERSLGKGATSSVYEGRHKKTGDQVAIKVLKKGPKEHYNAFYLQEMDILPGLEHANVIKFLGVEEGSRTGEKLVILEWCRGGSVYTLLEQPENKYGLPEAEVLAVLRDLGRAIEYLHKELIVHRDIKPGNIMVYIDETQTNVYKLADFGTAHDMKLGLPRTVEGTMEYLHPYMFRCALDKAPLKKCGHWADLWSLGCTMMHAMTGRLPWRTLASRKDRHTMLQLVHEKKSNSIAGEEISVRGVCRFEYHAEMPESCALSESCKASLVPLLAQLMEKDISKAMDITTFCREAEEISSQKPVIIFNMATCHHFMVYAEPKAQISSCLDEIQRYSGIAPSNQLLYHKGEYFRTENPMSRSKLGVSVSKRRPEGATSKEKPLLYNGTGNLKISKTSLDNPIILLSKEDRERDGEEQWADWPPGHEDMVKAALPKMPPSEGMGADYTLSKEVSGYVCLLGRSTRLVVMIQFIFVTISDTLRKHTKDNLECLKKTIDDQANTIELLRARTHSWLSNISDQLEQITMLAKLMCNVDMTTLVDRTTGDVLFSMVDITKSKAGPSLRKLEQRQTKLKDSLHTLQRKFEALELERLRDINPGCKEEDKCIQKVQDIERQAIEINFAFKRDKSLTSLGYNETQIHRYERNQLKDHLKKCEKQFRQCLDNYQILYRCVRHYVTKALKIQGHAMQLEEELKKVITYVQTFKEKQTQREDVVSAYFTQMKSLVSIPGGRLRSGLGDSGYASGKNSHTSLFINPPTVIPDTGLGTGSSTDISGPAADSGKESSPHGAKAQAVVRPQTATVVPGAHKNVKREAPISCHEEQTHVALAKSKIESLESGMPILFRDEEHTLLQKLLNMEGDQVASIKSKLEIYRGGERPVRPVDLVQVERNLLMTLLNKYGEHISNNTSSSGYSSGELSSGPPVSESVGGDQDTNYSSGSSSTLSGNPPTNLENSFTNRSLSPTGGAHFMATGSR